MIHELNKDTSIHGIILQLPLPQNFNRKEIINEISDTKDVDGILGTNSNLEAVTPKAIIDLLDFYQVQIKGKKILVIGNGMLVGLPLS